MDRSTTSAPECSAAVRTAGRASLDLLSPAAAGERGEPASAPAALLRGIPIERPNQVWSTDITYIPMHGGFLYLVAVMDWFSRFVLSWELSNTMETGFCLAALEVALRFGQPEIWNSDQGSQFTSPDFLAPLKQRGILISMDGRGRALDNVFIERLWRSLKYELIYPGDFASGADLFQALDRYFHFYNHISYCPTSLCA
jgi:putative transposase